MINIEKSFRKYITDLVIVKKNDMLLNSCLG